MSWDLNALIEEMVEGERSLRLAFAAPLEERQAEARRRQAAGEKPGCTTNIDDSITYGYGRLDPYGFWQYPLPEAYRG